MNKIILMGRLTKDNETRVGANTTVLKNSIAVDRKFNNSEVKTDFFNITAFGKTAEFIEKYFGKGKKILIVGRVQNDTYTNKEGNKVTATNVIVEEVEFCESANGSGQQKVNASEGYMSIPQGVDDELPFM